VAEEGVGRLLRRFMREAPGGPSSVTELARRMGRPRSTVHRHLRGGSISEMSIEAYAEALAEGPEERERVSVQLRRAAGYPVPSPSGRPAEIEPIVVELGGLDEAALDTIWRVVRLLHR